MSNWVSPSGHTAAGCGFTDPENVYDGVLATSGEGSTRYDAIELTLTAISCDKVRIYCDAGVAGQKADGKVEVYYSGSYHTLHDGLLNPNVWQELSIGSIQTVTKAQLTLQDFTTFRVFEFELNDLGSGGGAACLILCA